MIIIILSEGKEELKKLIIEFQEKYAQFKDLKRFSIPVKVVYLPENQQF